MLAFVALPGQMASSNQGVTFSRVGLMTSFKELFAPSLWTARY